MDDELQLTDPDHSDAQEAAAATARLLVAIHEQRCHQSAQQASQTTEEQQCQSTSNPTPK